MPDLPCPLLALTGVPCPLCGATRAVVAAARGDGAWLSSYNGWWVLVLAALAVVLLVRPVLVSRALRSPRAALLSLALLALPGWAWALVNRSTIG